MSLQELMNSGLPINRKERFYTATVFPMLVCRDGFRHFDRFTTLIEGYTPQPIDVRPKSANIQFFTEYSFFDSIFSTNTTKRFPNLSDMRDTPDIIILIQQGIHTTLIAVEAKMFLAPAPTSLHRQMTNQKLLLGALKDDLHIDHIYHVALVPERWQAALRNFEFPVITWQNLYKQFITIVPDDYFLEVLRIALDTYDDLVSRASGGKNNEGYMKGLAIYAAFKSGTLMRSVMGREKGGLYGKPIKDDFESGRWRTQRYETSSKTELANTNPNWFKIEDFIAQIDALDTDIILENP